MANNRKFLEIKRKDSIAQFERCLSDSDLSRYALRLPNTIYEGGSMGRATALAQLIATWASGSDEAIVARYAKSAERLDEFISSLHGFSGVYFCDKFFESTTEHDLRRDALTQAEPRIVAMHQRDYDKVRKGRRIELLSVLGAKHEFLPAFYRRKPVVSDLIWPENHGKLIVSDREMDGLFRECMEYMSPYRRSRGVVNRLFTSNAVGTLLHEAFRNTAEHAYEPPPSSRRRRGIRGLLIQNSQVLRTSFSRNFPISDGYPNAKDYFEKLAQLESGFHRKSVETLEISIFDTGPGLAKTMRALHADSRSDTELVKRCFQPFETSKRGKSSGLGFSRILATVKELNGFFRCRTSTCEVAFSSIDEIGDDGQDPKIHITGGLAEVVGTVMTICIPVAY